MYIICKYISVYDKCNQYKKFIDKTVPTEDIIKMDEFVLKNNLFEFN